MTNQRDEALTTITDALDAAALDYTIEYDDAIDVPGIGLIFWCDGDPNNPGLVARYEDYDDQVDVDDVLELIAHVKGA